MLLTSLNIISVIIPVRNEKDYIARCLESILTQHPVKKEIEVIVVDGMSTDGTRTIIREKFGVNQRVKYINNPKTIVPSALNLGILAARGHIIIRMDAHTIYPPDYISACMYWLETSGADNVGGLCLTKPANETPKAQAIALALSHPFGVGNSYFRIGSSEPRWVDTVPFGCYRREVFDKIGLFDEELVRNQDDEFNLRLKKQGGKILLVPEIVSEYYARDSLSKLWRMYWQYGFFKPLVARKIKGILTIRQLIPVLFILSLLIPGFAIWWLPPATKVLAIIVASYMAADLIFSFRSARDYNLKTRLYLLLAFPVMHCSYGLGYLKGIFNFWLVRRKNRPEQMQVPLSR